MNTDDLTTDQYERMEDAVLPALGYLCRLKYRMEKRGFHPDDPLFRLVDRHV